MPSSFVKEWRVHTVVDHYHAVMASLQEAAVSYHSLVSWVPQLVAVSKTVEAERIRLLLEAGHRVFGENRVQEAQQKWPALKETYPDIELHLIGPLQTNKVREAVALFDVIQTVDRLKLAEALRQEMDKRQRELPCLIQVNTGEEEQKAGIFPGEADGFIAHCREKLKLNIQGLMVIPPVEDNPAMHFALLKKLADNHHLPQLSMGMSQDYQLAAAMGATYVRVGSAVFGARN